MEDIGKWLKDGKFLLDLEEINLIQQQLME